MAGPTAAAGLGLAQFPVAPTRAAAPSQVLKFIPQADLTILDPIGTNRRRSPTHHAAIDV
jgi:hypothetical protein